MKKFINEMSTRRFWIYQLRWQISAIVMFLPMMYLQSLGFPLWITLSLGQLFGAFVFWEVDKFIFKSHKSDNIEYKIDVTVSERKL